MDIEKEKKLLSFIMVATGILLFVLIIGIVIFSLPDTTGDYQETTTESTLAEALATVDVVLETDGAADDEHEDKEQETADETAAPVTLRIVAYGDNLLHKGISEYSMLADGSYDFSSIYSDVASTAREADIAVVNQEVPLGGVELGISGYPNFNAPHEAADALSAAGINVLTMATNHILDVGAPGVVSTLEYIRTFHADMLTTGAYLTPEERQQMPILETKGIKTAFLNYTYGLNGHSSSQVVINVIDDELMVSDIKRAREEADLVVVCMHWGEENQLTPADEQRRLAALLCEAGADLIIGTHPHVVQPVEVLTSASGRQTVVYYSLGNLVSLQHEAANMLGGVADITYTFEDGKLVESDYRYSFVVTHWDNNHAGSHVYPWESYTPELAGVHGVTQFDASFSYDALKAIISQVTQ